MAASRCSTRCYTAYVPTKRPRHTITEVGPVEEALRRARHAEGDVDMRELIVLGAEAVVGRARERARTDERRAGARENAVRRLLSGAGIDAAAAHDARGGGFSRPL